MGLFAGRWGKDGALIATMRVGLRTVEGRMESDALMYRD